jgi:hypothetical protein
MGLVLAFIIKKSTGKKSHGCGFLRGLQLSGGYVQSENYHGYTSIDPYPHGCRRRRTVIRRKNTLDDFP